MKTCKRAASIVCPHSFCVRRLEALSRPLEAAADTSRGRELPSNQRRDHDDDGPSLLHNERAEAAVERNKLARVMIIQSRNPTPGREEFGRSIGRHRFRAEGLRAARAGGHLSNLDSVGRSPCAEPFACTFQGRRSLSKCFCAAALY